MKKRLSITIAVLLAAIALFGVSGIPAASIAFADDGGGGGGGAGGGGGGGGAGGGDSWDPFRNKRKSQRCSCVGIPFFLNCSCRRAKRSSRQGQQAAQQARPTAMAAPIRREIVSVGLSADDLDRLRQSGFEVLESRRSELMGNSIARLTAPRGRGVAHALRQIRAVNPAALAARNETYQRAPQAKFRPSGASCGDACDVYQTTAWTKTVGQCSQNMAIGVIDTGVDQDHPSLVGSRITLHTSRSIDLPPADKGHGTGVVSLLVGNGATEISGLTPTAAVYASDAFHKASTGPSASTYDLIAALDWLAERKVRVMNLSLTGPDNPIFAKGIRATLDTGITIVAAAGVPDRARTLGFPARYPDVVAVSAIDQRMRPSRLSSRGTHIAFAAPGTGLTVAAPSGTVQKVDGTSFASPFVAAAYAIGLAREDNRQAVTDRLVTSAKDLGQPGRDPIFGWGLIQYTGFQNCN